MGILAWIVVGIIAGWIATTIVPTTGSHGIGMDLIVGIVGAILGGWLFNLSGNVGVTGFNVWSIFVSIIGAVVLLAIVRAVTTLRRT